MCIPPGKILGTPLVVKTKDPASIIFVWPLDQIERVVIVIRTAKPLKPAAGTASINTLNLFVGFLHPMLLI